MSVAAAEIIIRGEVQGVGFRWFAYRKATELGVQGFVQNRADGSVGVHAEGERGTIESFIGVLRIGPRAARVEEVSVEWSEPTGKYPHFEITHD